MVENMLSNDSQVYCSDAGSRMRQNVNVILTTKTVEEFELTAVYLRCPYKNPFASPVTSIAIFSTSILPSLDDFNAFGNCTKKSFCNIKKPKNCTGGVLIELDKQYASSSILCSGTIVFEKPMRGKYLFVKLMNGENRDEDIGIEHIAFRGYTKTNPLAVAVDNDIISLSNLMSTGDEVYIIDKYMTGVKRVGIIIANRTNKDLSGIEYLVKFKGWSERWNEWINESSNRLFKVPSTLIGKDGENNARSPSSSPTPASEDKSHDPAWLSFISPLRDRFKVNQGKSPFDLVSIVCSDQSLSANLSYFEVKFLESKEQQTSRFAQAKQCRAWRQRPSS